LAFAAIKELKEEVEILKGQIKWQQKSRHQY
jgi:hypothetical protein